VDEMGYRVIGRGTYCNGGSQRLPLIGPIEVVRRTDEIRARTQEPTLYFSLVIGFFVYSLDIQGAPPWRLIVLWAL